MTLWGKHGVNNQPRGSEIQDPSLWIIDSTSYDYSLWKYLIKMEIDNISCINNRYFVTLVRAELNFKCQKGHTKTTFTRSSPFEGKKLINTHTHLTRKMSLGQVSRSTSHQNCLKGV